MATKPTTLPRWATDATYPVGHPFEGQPIIVEPDEDKKDLGEEPAEKPPAEFQNWFKNLVYQWVVYLNELAAGQVTFDNTATAYPEAPTDVQGAIEAERAQTLRDFTELIRDIPPMVEPQDTPDLTVILEANSGQVQTNRQNLDPVPDTVFDLSADVAALAAGESQIIAITLAPGGVWGQVNGTPTTGTPFVPPLTTDVFLVGLVTITEGMTQITGAEIVSPVPADDRGAVVLEYTDHFGGGAPENRTRYGQPSETTVIEGSGERILVKPATDPEGLSRIFMLQHADQRTLSLPAPGTGPTWWRIAKLSSPDGRGGGELRIGATGGATIPGDYVFFVSSDWDDDISVTQVSGPPSGQITGIRASKATSSSELFVDIRVDHGPGPANFSFRVTAPQDKVGGNDLIILDPPTSGVLAGTHEATLTGTSVKPFGVASTIGGGNPSRSFQFGNVGAFDPAAGVFMDNGLFYSADHGLGGWFQEDKPGVGSAEAITTSFQTFWTSAAGAVIRQSGTYMLIAKVYLVKTSNANGFVSFNLNKFSGPGSLTAFPSFLVRHPANGHEVAPVMPAIIGNADETTRFSIEGVAESNGQWDYFNSRIFAMRLRN